MILILLFASTGILCSCKSNNKEVANPNAAGDYFAMVKLHREHTDQFFKNSSDSPLSQDNRLRFKGLQYFAPDTNFIYVATFEKISDGPIFKMEVTGSSADFYQTVGRIHFVINSTECALEVYENQTVKAQGITSYFIPFKDQTCGISTYSGGRYLDLEIVKGVPIRIDFNFAYQPYCTYNHEYSCPIPPPVNVLPVAIEAGERM